MNLAAMNGTATGSVVSLKSLSSQTACFSVSGVSGPEMLPRVLGEFSKQGLVPSKLHSALDRRADGEDRLTVDLQMSGMDMETAEYIGRRLRRIWGVDTVLVASLKQPV